MKYISDFKGSAPSHERNTEKQKRANLNIGAAAN